MSSVTGGTAEFDVNEWKLNESKDIIYRVQVGAFTQEANELVFQYLPNVIKLTSDDGYTRYFTGTFNGYKKPQKPRSIFFNSVLKELLLLRFKGVKKSHYQVWVPVCWKNEDNSSKHKNHLLKTKKIILDSECS